MRSEENSGNKATLAYATIDWFDGMLVVGYLLLVIGIGMIYRPAGLIAAGLLLMAGGILGAWKGSTPSAPSGKNTDPVHRPQPGSLEKR